MVEQARELFYISGLLVCRVLCFTRLLHSSISIVLLNTQVRLISTQPLDTMSQFDTKQVPMEVGIEKGASEFIEDAPAANHSSDNILRDAELMAGESQEKVSRSFPR